MPVGRKPKPSYLREVTGNPGRRRRNEREPQPPPPPDVFAPPEHLAPAAAAKWRDLAPKLAACGALSELDLDAFGRYCECYAGYRSAQRELERIGAVVKTPAGYPVLSPYFAIRNRYFEQLSKLETEFGLTPSARSRVRADPDGGLSGGDPAERYFG